MKIVRAPEEIDLKKRSRKLPPWPMWKNEPEELRRCATWNEQLFDVVALLDFRRFLCPSNETLLDSSALHTKENFRCGGKYCIVVAVRWFCFTIQLCCREWKLFLCSPNVLGNFWSPNCLLRFCITLFGTISFLRELCNFLCVSENVDAGINKFLAHCFLQVVVGWDKRFWSVNWKHTIGTSPRQLRRCFVLREFVHSDGQSLFVRRRELLTKRLPTCRHLISRHKTSCFELVQLGVCRAFAPEFCCFKSEFALNGVVFPPPT